MNDVSVFNLYQLVIVYAMFGDMCIENVYGNGYVL